MQLASLSAPVPIGHLFIWGKGKLPFPSSVVPKSSYCRIVNGRRGLQRLCFALSDRRLVDGCDRNTHKFQSMTQHPCIKFSEECSFKKKLKNWSCIWSATWVIKPSLRRWVMMSFLGNHRWDSRRKIRAVAWKEGERQRLEATGVMWKSVSGRRGGALAVRLLASWGFLINSLLKHDRNIGAKSWLLYCDDCSDSLDLTPGDRAGRGRERARTSVYMSVSGDTFGSSTFPQTGGFMCDHQTSPIFHTYRISVVKARTSQIVRQNLKPSTKPLTARTLFAL